MSNDQQEYHSAAVEVDITNKVGPDGREASSSMRVNGDLRDVQQQLDLAALSRGDARRAEGQWPKKFGWLAWVVAAVLAAVAFLFLILFLTTRDDEKVDATTAPAPTPVTQVLTDDRSLAAEANIRAGRAQDTADTALTVANTAMDESRVARDEAGEAKVMAGNALTGAAKLATVHAPRPNCVADNYAKAMAMFDTRAIISAGMLFPVQVWANAEEACKR